MIDVMTTLMIFRLPYCIFFGKPLIVLLVALMFLFALNEGEADRVLWCLIKTTIPSSLLCHCHQLNSISEKSA